MQKIRTIIIEDEPLPRKRLTSMLRSISDIDLIGVFEDSSDAVGILENSKIDLMFSDIQMPETDGISLFKSLSNPPYVIFVTAYPEYAVQGFELDSIDYILKPLLTHDRLLKCIEKVKRAISFNRTANDQEFVKLKDGHKTLFLKSKEILYVHAYGDYVRLFTSKNVELKLKTMKEMEESLPKKYFVRIHRSYLINISEIESVDMTKVILKGIKDAIPIGSKYRDLFFKKIGME